MALKAAFADETTVLALIANRKQYEVGAIVAHVTSCIIEEEVEGGAKDRLGLIYCFLGRVPITPEYLALKLPEAILRHIVISWMAVENSRPIEANCRLVVESSLINFICDNIDYIVAFSKQNNIKYKIWSINLLSKRLIIWASVKKLKEKEIESHYIIKQEWMAMCPNAGQLAEVVTTLRPVSEPLCAVAEETLEKILAILKD